MEDVKTLYSLPKDLLIKIIIKMYDDFDVEKLSEEKLRKLKEKVDNQIYKYENVKFTWDIFIMNENYISTAKRVTKNTDFKGTVKEILDEIMEEGYENKYDIFNRYNQEILLESFAINYKCIQLWIKHHF